MSIPPHNQFVTSIKNNCYYKSLNRHHTRLLYPFYFVCSLFIQNCSNPFAPPHQTPSPPNPYPKNIPHTQKVALWPKKHKVVKRIERCNKPYKSASGVFNGYKTSKKGRCQKGVFFQISCKK